MDLSRYHFTLRMQVRDYEIDAEGIVNNAVYLNYMEHTRHQFCQAAGLSFAAMRAAGIDPVVTKIEIEYKHPLRSGDEMLSCLSVSRRGPLYVFDQDIFTLDGEPVVHARVAVASLRDGKPTRGDELAPSFAKYL